MTSARVIGLRGSIDFNGIVEFYTGLGGDVVLLDPDMVCGKDHLISAVMHADRAFDGGYNRSKTILTEIILYSAGERQIGKALKAMKPKEGQDTVVAVLIGFEEDIVPKNLDLVRDDSILEPSMEKATRLGVDVYGKDISPEDLVLEMVASVDILKT